jgi:hypothetical protein
MFGRDHSLGSSAVLGAFFITAVTIVMMVAAAALAISATRGAVDAPASTARSSCARPRATIAPIEPMMTALAASAFSVSLTSSRATITSIESVTTTLAASAFSASLARFS